MAWEVVAYVEAEIGVVIGRVRSCAESSAAQWWFALWPTPNCLSAMSGFRLDNDGTLWLVQGIERDVLLVALPQVPMC